MPHSLRLFAGVLVLALPLGSIGCGGDSTGTGSDGEAVAEKYDCADCHSPTKKNTDLSGSTKNLKGTYGKEAYGPNLTPDNATGIGTWTDAEIKAAILDGKKKDGSILCSVMPVFGSTCDQNKQTCEGPISDTDADALVTYLTGLKAVSNKIPATPSPCH